MSAVEKQTWTVEQYLETERASEEKHEYLNGEIYLMAGASPRHNKIQGNAFAALHTQLQGHPCDVYSSDQRVGVVSAKLYTYPDISIVCDPPQFDEVHHDTLLNPILIVEVLSPSTSNYDRSKKFWHYRTLDSLKEYVLIFQDVPRVERYLRQPSGDWLLTDAVGLDAVLELPSVQATLVLADVYRRVSFESE